MSFEQIRASSGEDHVIDEDAFLQTLQGEVGSRWRTKFGIIGSVTLGAAALILVVIAPDGARSIVSESVVSLAGFKRRYTSPYYSKVGGCPEGDLIEDKATCWEALKLVFPGGDAGKNKEGCGGGDPGCLKNYGSNNGACFNSNLGGKQINSKEYLCKTKADALPDYAELQSDANKLIVHCLEATPDHSSFKECVLQITGWDKDEAEQQKKAAEAAEAAKKSCAWTKHADKFSGGYANGVKTKYDLAGAKKRCLELSGCVAVTCPSSDECTVRGGALGDSPNGEVTYTPDC